MNIIAYFDYKNAKNVCFINFGFFVKHTFYFYSFSQYKAILRSNHRSLIFDNLKKYVVVA